MLLTSILISMTLVIVLQYRMIRNSMWRDTEQSEFLFHRQAIEDFYIDGRFGDNISGFPSLIVPNIVHYVLFGDHVLSFVHYISIKSVLRNQNPDRIMIHCDCDQLQGKYWDRLFKEINTTKILIRRIKMPTTVFGQRFDFLNKYWHASDVARNRVLMEYGGIYLDRDIYVVKSLDVFRKFEMTVSKERKAMSNCIQIGHKNARFLKLYLRMYEDYRGRKWSYNSLELPRQKIIAKYPHLVNFLTNDELGVDFNCPMLYQMNWSTWQQEYYSLHLFMRGHSMARFCLVDFLYKPYNYFDEESVKKLNVTFGQMARLVLYNTTDYV